MSIGLDDDELQELTGYRRRTMQRRILDANGIAYFVAASGRPIVLKENLVERKVTGPNGPQTHTRLRLAAKAA